MSTKPDLTSGEIQKFVRALHEVATYHRAGGIYNIPVADMLGTLAEQALCSGFPGYDPQHATDQVEAFIGESLLHSDLPWDERLIAEFTEDGVAK
jgi:hypothetical protein